jgi:UDP-N-acetyl-D-mannosaminuronic acid dehydrogenase
MVRLNGGGKTVKLDLLVIGGGGHVGLPLALAFADTGLKVGIYDINRETLKMINDSRMPFKEEGAGELLKRVINRNLFTYDDPKIISNVKNIVVVIGTPVDEHLNPRFTLMKKFFLDVMEHFRDGQNVILRSTVYPGTTEKVDDLLRENRKKVNVCFCPERVAEGFAIKEIRELPQIISGTSGKAVAEASKLFRRINKKLIFLSPIEAELAKLFTNTYRYINFAIANQFYMTARDHGLDFYRIYDAVTRDYPRAKSMPKPGFTAGPCLFKDTMQIASFNNNSFFLGHSAMLINEGLPNYVVSLIKKSYDVKNMKVGILGMAFKGDSDDKRESLSYKLKKICEVEFKKVYCSDVYIREEGFVTAPELIKKSDLVIIGTPHREYLKLNIPKNKLMDIWGFYKKRG